MGVYVYGNGNKSLAASRRGDAEVLNKRIAASIVAAAAAAWMRMLGARRLSELRHTRRDDLPLSNQCLYNKQQITSVVRILVDELYIRLRVQRGTVIVSSKRAGVVG